MRAKSGLGTTPRGELDIDFVFSVTCKMNDNAPSSHSRVASPIQLQW